MGFFKRARFTSSKESKKSIPDGLWIKCVTCGQTVYKNDIELNLQVCPHCEHHYRIGARERIASLVDAGSFEERHQNVTTGDPLHFAVGQETYPERIVRAKEQSGLSEALVGGFATIETQPAVVGAMDSKFIMASMGSALGERFARLVRDAVESRRPLIMFAASGGARMQEGILALMQMAKTANAVRQVNEAGLPYIVVLTDPTSGGVFASWATLGDIIIAEPKAYVGFAGTRLIEGALKVKIPAGFQTAEYQLENGFVDHIVKRTEMREHLGKLLRYLAPQASLRAHAAHR
ncbi:MAG: acetyl-CoA carboxylase carboxyltransferase subunit beta [Candidatus Hydrogenedentes bacterium]|nr:acetyl-CoA carboxylase carboxyltransferase subunit beta [Candidatus Hydrogenedentota bacterium]